MAPGRSSDPDRVEGLLRELPAMELLGLLRRSSNYTFLARLGEKPSEGGEERQADRERVLTRVAAAAAADGDLLAVYKPARGESPLWDFPSGRLYAREVAAYLLARELGWPHVPPTVVREHAPLGIGAVQLFVSSRPNVHYLVDDGTPEQTWIEIAIFDVLINNADRKSGHCLVDEHSDTVWVIDHGLTFHSEPKLRTVIWDFAGRAAPRRLREDLERCACELESGELRHLLEPLLSPPELASLRRRLGAVLRPDWRLPRPSSSWSVPWPPV